MADHLNNKVNDLVKKDFLLTKNDHYVCNSSMISRDYLWSKNFHVKTEDVKYIDEMNITNVIPFKKHKRDE